MRLRVFTEPAAGFKLDKSISLSCVSGLILLDDADEVLDGIDHTTDLWSVVMLDDLIELLEPESLERELLSLRALDLATYLLDLYR